MNSILETTKFVVDNAKDVKINKTKIKEFCKRFGESHINHWLNESPFNISKLSDKDKINFLLIFDAISFSYWGEPKWTIEYKGEKFDGAWGMIASLGKAIENNIPIFDMKYLSNISEEDFEKIVKGNIKIPLFEERLKILREISQVLIKEFKGDFTEVIKKAEGDINKLLELIINLFPSFNDSTIYDGEKIYFYKRAQLLISDINQIFKGEKYGKFDNINELTACADYKLPKVLRELKILKYSKRLSEKIDNKIEILKDSKEEIEIRACTIWANEFIKDELRKSIPQINTIHINDHLWLLGQLKSPMDKPYHRTRTISY